MTPSQRRYLRTETAIGAGISAVLSVLFVLIFFGGRDSIPVGGLDGIVVDALPQSMIIALMSSLVPILLTRMRVAKGLVEPIPGSSFLPTAAFLRALVIAVLAGLLAMLAHAVLLVLPAVHWSFEAVAVFKAIYGGLSAGS